MSLSPYAIPGIEIGEEIGRGSFGCVYRGRHITLDVPVAVKILDGISLSADAQKAVREGRIMARLDHPNILRIHDTGLSGSAVYHVLEFMDGGSLEGTRQMPAMVLEDVARQMLSALQCLHDAGVVHRDMKPANCLKRSADGRIKLADLGVAASTETLKAAGGAMAGTLAFMAPELFEGAPASFRSDLYALGMTLACLALHADPFPSGSLGSLIDWVLKSERPSVVAARKDLPFALSSLIDKLLRRRPEERPERASEALSWLDAPLSVAPTKATDPTRCCEKSLGPWVLGDLLREGITWRSYAAAHRHSGIAARVVHLQATGPLKNASDMVLEAAARSSSIDHPGVLDVMDWGLWEKRAYVITAPMGQPIQHLVRSSGPMPEREVVHYGLQIAQALSHLHARGLVYQIVEPFGVNLGADGRSVLLGWPLFCVPAGSLDTHNTDRPMRTLIMAHAAPEVFRGALTIEHSVDLYGLGEVLFFLLTGRNAHPGNTTGDLVLTKLAAPPEVREFTQDCTAPTATLVRSLLDPEPARRPSAKDVSQSLARIARRLNGLSSTVLESK